MTAPILSIINLSVIGIGTFYVNIEQYKYFSICTNYCNSLK